MKLISKGLQLTVLDDNGNDVTAGMRRIKIEFEPRDVPRMTIEYHNFEADIQEFLPKEEPVIKNCGTCKYEPDWISTEDHDVFKGGCGDSDLIRRGLVDGVGFRYQIQETGVDDFSLRDVRECGSWDAKD